MTFATPLKIAMLITAVASWTSPSFAADPGDPSILKASKFVANAARAHQSPSQGGNMCKIRMAWSATPLILGIGGF